MPSNRRRHANALPLLSLLTWTVVAAFVCVAGLGYVYGKNQLHRAGDETRKLERELQELKTATAVARSKIALLSSTEALKRKLDAHVIDLDPITDAHIVRIGSLAPARAGENPGMRAVANERTAP